MKILKRQQSVLQTGDSYSSKTRVWIPLGLHVYTVCSRQLAVVQNNSVRFDVHALAVQTGTLQCHGVSKVKRPNT